MKQVTNKVLWIFAIGQLGWSMLSGIIVNWLVYYYQPADEVMKLGMTTFVPQKNYTIGFVSLTIVGIITALCRVFDAVTDPLVASKSDRSRHKDGRRIPFMRAIAVPFGIITVLVFISPTGGENLINSGFLLAMLLLFYLSMTIYCTPYNALIPELGKSPKDRINLSTYISVTYFVGTAAAYLLPNIAGIFRDGLEFSYVNAFRMTVGIMAAIAVICMLIPVFFIKESDYADTTPSDTPAFKSLGKTFKNRQFIIFVFSDILYWVALTIFQTGLPYYVISLLGLGEDKNFLLFATMTGVSLVFYAPVNILAKKLGKKKLIVIAFAIFAGTFLLTSFSGKLGISGMANGFLIAVLAAIPMAILGILPQAIVADIAQADGIKTGENRQGMFFAARTFAMKLGQSVALLLFTSLTTDKSAASYRTSAVIAAIFCLGGAIVLSLYKEKRIQKIISENADVTEGE